MSLAKSGCCLAGAFTSTWLLLRSEITETSPGPKGLVPVAEEPMPPGLVRAVCCVAVPWVPVPPRPELFCPKGEDEDELDEELRERPPPPRLFGRNDDPDEPVWPEILAVSRTGTSSEGTFLSLYAEMPACSRSVSSVRMIPASC